MSSLYLPPEILDLIAEETDKKTLPNFSLVCKDWEWPAKKLIWHSIRVSGSLFDELMNLLEKNKELEVLVKKADLLVLTFRDNLSYLKLDQFTELLARLSNLVALESINDAVTCWDFSLNRCNGFELKFELPNITSLKYSIGIDDKELCILRELLRTAVNLTTLNLEIDDEFPADFIPIQQCASLTSLQINVRLGIDVLNPSHFILSLSSLSNLKKLVFHRLWDIHYPGLLKIIQQTHITLEHLALETQIEQVRYDKLIKSLGRCRSMKTLRIISNLDPCIDLFQHLPSSLQNVDIDIPIQKSHLEHLRLHPRLDLTFDQLTMKNSPVVQDEEVLEVSQFLPKHVKIIYYSENTFYQLHNLLENFKKLVEPSKVKRIVIGSMLKPWSYDINVEIVEKRKNSYIREFAELGIKLDVRRWK